MVDCGLMLEPQEGMKVEEIVSWAKYAEDKGYGYLFRSDHLLATSGKSDLESSECWVTLGVVAAKTTRVRFGPMVSPVGFRNPSLLAKMACTLHSYSHGRLVLSVGAGWYEREYRANGFPFPSFAERKEQLREALEIIRPITQGRKVQFDGKHFSANTEFPLPPDSGKMHLVVGGKDREIVEYAGMYADELNLYSPNAETVNRVKGILDTKKKKEEEAKGERREGEEEVILSQMGPFFIAESEQELGSILEKSAKRWGIQKSPRELISEAAKNGVPCGTPESLSSQLDEKRKLGLKKFYFQLQDPSDRASVDLLTKTLSQFH